VPVETSLIFILLLLYVVLGGYMEHKKVIVGHETGVALIIGMIISAIIHAFNKDFEFTFDTTIFFYVCLPPIIFAAGYNMRRKRFFENIGYILIFGVFGTILTFLVFAGLTYAAMEGGIVSQYV